MKNFEARITQLVNAFAADLTALAREAARATLDEALDGSLGRASGRVGRASAPASGSRSRGEKRSPADLVKIQDKVLSFVASSPGLRIEQINKAMGTNTTELALPLRKLVADGALKTEGQRRATKYFPGSGQRSAPRRGRRKKG